VFLVRNWKGSKGEGEKGAHLPGFAFGYAVASPPVRTTKTPRQEEEVLFVPSCLCGSEQKSALIRVICGFLLRVAGSAPFPDTPPGYGIIFG
jgi:hypothetical protein